MDWQILVVLFITGLAVAWLVRRAVLAFRGRGGSCGGCHGCDAAPGATSRLPVRRQLYSLSDPRPRSDERRL